MSIFHQQPTAEASESRPDYLFLESVSPTISPERGAHLMAIKSALAKHHIAVLSGGIDARAEDNFRRYRDKGHFFTKGVQHQNFFAELHGHREQTKRPLTALPLMGYLGSLTAYEDYAHSATVYNDEQGLPVYRVERDESGSVTSISYFVKGHPVRTDTYDEHHRLLLSEQFGAVANPARLASNDDKPSIQGLMSRTVYRENGQPAFAQTYSPQQLWLLDENCVPTRLFATESALMAWWLMSQLDGHNRIYLTANSSIFNQLASYPKLRSSLVPIIQDQIDERVLAGAPFPQLLVDESLRNTDYSKFSATVLTVTGWRRYLRPHSWSVYSRG